MKRITTVLLCVAVAACGRNGEATKDEIQAQAALASESDSPACRQGTGIGLSISRDRTRGMAGDPMVTSEPGAGSTFELRLPHAM